MARLVDAEQGLVEQLEVLDVARVADEAPHRVLLKVAALEPVDREAHQQQRLFDDELFLIARGAAPLDRARRPRGRLETRDPINEGLVNAATVQRVERVLERGVASRPLVDGRHRRRW